MPFGKHVAMVALVMLIVPARVVIAADIKVGNVDNQVVLRADASVPHLLAVTRRSAVRWDTDSSEPLIATANVEDRDVALHWHFDAAASRLQSRSATLVYANDQPALRLSWEWRAADAHGPLEHTIRIENRSGSEVWMPLQQSLSVRWHIGNDTALEQLWIDKGAGEAPPVGTHRVAVGDGYEWRGESSTFAHPQAGEPREIIPYLLVHDAHRAWYAGVEFSGRVALTLARRGNALDTTLALNDRPAPFRTRLAPGETFIAPTIFLGVSDGDVDDTGNTLRRWVRAVLNDPATLRDPHYPWLTNNSWGSATAITDAQARRMIDDAHELGFEMFHLDAGWFRAVGDWHPDAEKFPRGVASLADYAHARDMKFGLWSDWAQAGTSRERGALNIFEAPGRDWLTTRPPQDWKPAQFKGVTIDLGVPAARDWAKRETNRIVGDYHIDMLEHDGYVVAQGCDASAHPHAPIDPQNTHRYSDDEFLWVDSTNSTDVSLRATNAYYDVQSSLKRQHPGLLLEICNDGGRMVDFGSAAHGDYFSIVDSYDPVSNRQAFYDASHVLPSAMLETYVKEWLTPRIENFRYMLRSGMMGWMTVMIDTNSWTPEQHAVAASELAFYKSTLRPLIREADLYHVAARADDKGWDGIEYFDARRGRGVLFAFHGGDASPDVNRFTLRGVRAGERYRLHFRDGSAPDRETGGHELIASGLIVRLPFADSSEVVVIERISR